MISRIFAVLIFIITAPFLAHAQEFSSSNLIQHAKRGTVSINNKLIASLYSSDTSKEIYGTGFIINKKQGLIVTNEHLASKKRISEYKVNFFNGREAEARFLYSDPWVDFAILKVDPKDIPKDATQLELSDEIVENEDNITIIGNNQGNNYSIQSGIVTNLYESWGPFPYQNIIISLNIKGGSSGSPILNKKGQVVALNYAGDQTYAAAIPIAYIKDALKSLNQNKVPFRRDIGVMLNYYSLDKAATFSNFPKALIDEYTKRYPTSFSKALKVTMVLEDSPAYGILKPGDIIWRVNNIDIGPELYKFQRMLNMSLSDIINLEVYRNGKLLNLKVPLYDLNQIEASKTVMFGGATFVEIDNYLRLITGAPKGKVFITNVSSGSSFDVLPWVNVSDYGLVYLINVVSINNIPINTMDDLIKAIPELMQTKNFKMNFRNYAYYQGFDSAPYTNRNEFEVEIKYNSPDSEPTIMSYNNKKLEWVSQKIDKFEKTKVK